MERNRRLEALMLKIEGNKVSGEGDIEEFFNDIFGAMYIGLQRMITDGIDAEEAKECFHEMVDDLTDMVLENNNMGGDKNDFSQR